MLVRSNASVAATLALASVACGDTASTTDLSRTRPSPSPGGSGPTVRYRCADGRVFTAMFDAAADTATLGAGRRAFARLAGRRPASGIWYQGDGYELRGKGVEARLTAPDGSVATCVTG